MTTPTPRRDRLSALDKAVTVARSRAATPSLVSVPDGAGSAWFRELEQRLESIGHDLDVDNAVPHSTLRAVLSDAAAAVRVTAAELKRRERQVAIAEEALATAPTRRDSDPATTRQAPPLPTTRSQAYALLEAFGEVRVGDVVVTFEHEQVRLVVDVIGPRIKVRREGGRETAEVSPRDYAVPMTSEEAAERSDRVSLRSEYAKRCSDLCAAGLIRDTGGTREGATGKRRILYAITETGRDYLRANPRD